MKRFIYTNMLFFIFCLTICGQGEPLKMKAYYSKPNELTIIIQNLIDDEISILLATEKSYIEVECDSSFKERIRYGLESTDSMQVWIKIPPHKLYLATYNISKQLYDKQNKSIKYSKVYPQIYYYITDTIPHKWNDYVKELSIEPYNKTKQYLVDSTLLVLKEKLSGDTVYSKVDSMPEFPGGLGEMYRYIRKKASHSHDYQGRVLVQVIIEKDGSISHPFVILNSLSEEVQDIYEKEAFKIVEQMPKWIPGKHNGKPVRVFQAISVFFKLD